MLIHHANTTILTRTFKLTNERRQSLVSLHSWQGFVQKHLQLFLSLPLLIHSCRSSGRAEGKHKSLITRGWGAQGVVRWVKTSNCSITRFFFGCEKISLPNENELWTIFFFFFLHPYSYCNFLGTLEKKKGAFY